MRFAIKKINSAAKNLDYPKDRVEITTILKAEQRNFCAYTEKYLSETEIPHIEHFNDTLKNTAADNYFNWYLVAPWANTGKPKINPEKFTEKSYRTYFPIIQPEQAFAKNVDEMDRIFYDKSTNKYEPVNEADENAKNLIDFIDLNNQSLYNERLEAIKRIAKLKNRFNYSNSELEDYLLDDPFYLNFITAIETHFELRLFAQLQP